MKFIDQVKVFNSSTVQPLWNHFLQKIILSEIPAFLFPPHFNLKTHCANQIMVKSKRNNSRSRKQPAASKKLGGKSKGSSHDRILRSGQKDFVKSLGLIRPTALYLQQNNPLAIEKLTEPSSFDHSKSGFAVKLKGLPSSFSQKLKKITSKTVKFLQEKL